MPDDIPVDFLISSAESALSAASEHVSFGNPKQAAELLERAVADLLSAGSCILSGISSADMAALNSSPARILRTLAEQFGVLPKDHQLVFALVPYAEEILGEEISQAARTHQPISGVRDVAAAVYESWDEGTVLSDEETTRCFFAGKTLLELLEDQRALKEAMFAEDGAYDAFSNAAVPYLTAAAAYLDETGCPESYEENIPKILDGTVKRLFRLLVSLLTSAFTSGLALLVIRRLITDSAAPPVSANLPVLIDGALLAAAELRELHHITDGSGSGLDVPAE